MIQTGSAFGMQTMDQALANLYLKGLIDYKDALENSIDPKEIKRILHMPS